YFFLWVWIVVTPLPIVFLPNRGLALLFIVLAGWALLAGSLAEDAARALSRFWTKAPGPLTEGTVAALLLPLYIWATSQHLLTIGPGTETATLISQLRALPVRPAKGSSVVFLHDPFEGYDAFFVSSLVWNDHSLTIFLQNHSNPSQEELSGFDYI